MAVASHDQLEYSAREEQFRSEVLDYLREPVNQHLKALQRRVLTIVEQKIQAINLSAFTSSVTEDRRRTLVEMVGDEVLFNLPRIVEQDSSSIPSGDGNDFVMGNLSELERGESVQEV